MADDEEASYPRYDDEGKLLFLSFINWRMFEEFTLIVIARIRCSFVIGHVI